MGIHEKMIPCANSSDAHSKIPRRAGSDKCLGKNFAAVSKKAACAAGCKKCGGGGNFTQPRTNKGRACGIKRGNAVGQPCELFTSKTKFACGYKCGWKGPCYWDFTACGLQWGNHVGGDGSRASSSGSKDKCNQSCNGSSCAGCASCGDCSD